jgi:hypothetical protein
MGARLMFWRLPDDVREEYGRLYGARHEAKFAPKTTKVPSAAYLTRARVCGLAGDGIEEQKVH